MSDRRVVRRCTQCFDEFWTLASAYESHCPPCTRKLRADLTTTRDDLQRALVERGLVPGSQESDRRRAQPPPPDPAELLARFKDFQAYEDLAQAQANTQEQAEQRWGGRWGYVARPPVEQQIAPVRRDADEPLVTADVAQYLEEWFAKEPA